GGTLDLVRAGGSGKYRDTTRYITGVADYYINNTPEGIYYLAKTDNGFKSVLFDKSKKYTDIRSFSGDPVRDYLRCGDFMLEKSSNKIFSVLADDIYDIEIEGGNNFKASSFVIDADGKKAFLYGISDNKTTIAVCGIEKQTTVCYKTNDLAFIENPIMLDDGKTAFTRARDKDGSGFYYSIVES
ncbi:MAG: hypothetical protein FWF08_08645, partial [Oscillospiraceae bacterium]|nr:hypothetical protein [Oscillospiraceae bacterium]